MEDRKVEECISLLFWRASFLSVFVRLSCFNSNSSSNSHVNVYGAVIVEVHCHCKSSPGSSDECSTQRQVAADLWTKPINLS